MTGIGIFAAVLIILYILSRIFIQKLFILLLRLTHDREDAAQLLGWIFLPGTFVHEVSHFISALFLLVRVGKMNLMPEVTEKGIKLGSVQIGETDFIRGSLIGLAPVIAGGGIMFWGITFALAHLSTWWIILLAIYAIFEITQTMFSSSRDLEAVLELVVFVAVLSAALVLLKIYAPFTFICQKLTEAGPVIQKFSYFLFIPIILELTLLGILKRRKI